jgi:hypothetical protein
VRDRLKASQVYIHVYFRYPPCLTDFTFEFIRRPISLILSPSSRTFVELTLVTGNQRSSTASGGHIQLHFGLANKELFGFVIFRFVRAQLHWIFLEIYFKDSYIS